MKSVYVITMWSGGRPAKKWKSDVHPELLSTGTGVSFVNAETRMSVRVVGSISVEEFESGKEELDQAIAELMRTDPLDRGDKGIPGSSDSNIRRLF